jgi:lipopolysaccharide export system protein LptA
VNRTLLLHRATLTALALAALLAAPARLQAQTGLFSPQTGLELDNANVSKSAEKKPKPAVPNAEKKATEITCSGETLFDVKAGVATFIKEVKIADPQFALSSDKLIVYLKKTEKAEVKPDAKPAPEPVPTPKADAPASPASGLERAVAEGNVIITQDKVDEKTGEITHYIGKGAKADYNAITGEMTLTGWPQIQQGLNNQVATEEGTVMIMNKDGHLRTVGRSKTVIQADAKPAKPETAKPSPSQVP